MQRKQNEIYLLYFCALKQIGRYETVHKILYDSHTRGFITQRCNRGCGFFVRSDRLQSRELHFDAGAYRPTGHS